MAPVPRVKHHVSADATQSRCRGIYFLSQQDTFDLSTVPL